MLAACDGPARPPSAEVKAEAPKAEVKVEAPAAETPKVEAPKADAGAQRFTGVLRYTEIKPVKSVESYMGREYSLTTSDEVLNLKPSATVSHEQLRALDGKEVMVVARFHPEELPPPNVQAPMDGDGPMPWPAYYEVLELAGPAPR